MKNKTVLIFGLITAVLIVIGLLVGWLTAILVIATACFSIWFWERDEELHELDADIAWFWKKRWRDQPKGQDRPYFSEIIRFALVVLMVILLVSVLIGGVISQ